MFDTGTPQMALDRVTPHLADFGITRVANVTGLDRLGVPVYMVCRPNSRSLAVFQGKGTTPVAARVSGLMEAIECYHAENLASDLEDSLIHVPQELRARMDRFTRLKDRPFDEGRILKWIRGRDLISCAEKLVPYQCVHMDCTQQDAAEPQTFISDTTGLASGSSMVQAINHALCETIERDALALWSLTSPAGKQARKIKLQGIQDDFVRSFLKTCDDMGVAVAAWDITTDIGVPSYICKIMMRDYIGNGVRPAFGSGTHLSPIIALQKAMTEAAQSRITFIAGARDDQYAAHYDAQLSENVYRRWYADVVEQPEIRAFTDTTDIALDTAEANQALLLEKLVQQGLDEVIAVDLTKEEFDIPVVKIIVPGLEGVSFSGERLVGARGLAYLAAQEGRV
jgi:ribosomal protein S12 methylthiotransferase accessory factor